MKKIVQLILIICPFALVAQQPVINTIQPTHVEVGETVTITGTNLAGRVFFGGVEAASVSGSGNQMEAEVPAGVTHGSIVVLHSTSDLSAESSQKFFISFSGSDASSYDAESLFTTGETDANDICLCDLDGDDLNDVIISHSVGVDLPNDDVEGSIFLNQSTAAATAFTKTITIDNVANTSGFITANCADLDNDGRPDVVFTADQGTSLNHVYVYENQSVTTGTIVLNELSLPLLLPSVGTLNRIPRDVKVADMDGDGLKDMVVGNDFDNTLHIFRNTSTGPGNFSFADPVEIDADGEQSGIIDLVDLDGDGRFDIVSLPFRTDGNRIQILKNNSVTGNFSFEAQASITNGGQNNAVSSGDLDGDGLIDIVVASRNGGLITTFRNSSSGSAITFDAGENLAISTASPSPFGLDLGDMNGDGLLDIVSTFAVKNVSVFPNTSTSGDVSFGSEIPVTTSQTTQYVCVGDLNADAKPDLAFTHNVQAGGPIGDLGVFMNRNCVEPVLDPNNLTVCLGDQFTVFATKAGSVNDYVWSVTAPATATIIDNGDNALVTIDSSPGTAEITVSVDQAGTGAVCTASSTTYTVVGGTQPTIPEISADYEPASIICAGDGFVLTVDAPFGNATDSYEWTLPDGSISTATQINVASASSNDAGDYLVRVSPSSGCFSELSVPFNVDIEEAPVRTIVNLDCSVNGTEITLDVGSSGDFSYSWKRDGSAIGETGTTILTNVPGTYTVDVETNTNNCITESESFVLPTLPVAAFSLATEICQDVPLQLTSSSTGDASFTLTDAWEVLDNSNGAISATDTTQVAGNPLNFSFDNLGTYNIRLVTEYSDFDICADTLIRSIAVTAPPTITFSVAEDTEKCQDEGLNVGITAPDAANITNYEWSINGVITSGATETTADAVTLPGIDSVYAVLTVTTDVGCTVMDSVKIKNFPTDADISSPNPAYDFTNDIDTLEEDSFVELTAENLTSITGWSPGSIIDDSTATTVTVFPSTSSTVITLSGVDLNGCAVSTSVTIVLDNVRPKRTFSPNGDGVNDFWEILNTDVLAGCEVFIFDSRGKNILVADSPFPNNEVWDGNFSGSPVPEGIYYFVLKCSDSNLSKSGSILLAR